MVLGRLCAKTLASPRTPLEKVLLVFPLKKGLQYILRSPGTAPKLLKLGENQLPPWGNPAEFSGNFPSSHLWSICLP